MSLIDSNSCSLYIESCPLFKYGRKKLAAEKDVIRTRQIHFQRRPKPADICTTLARLTEPDVYSGLSHLGLSSIFAREKILHQLFNSHSAFHLSPLKWKSWNLSLNVTEAAQGWHFSILSILKYTSLCMNAIQKWCQGRDWKVLHNVIYLNGKEPYW